MGHTATRHLSVDEQIRLLRACSCERDRLILNVGFQTGFKIGEILSITVGHVYHDLAIRRELTIAPKVTGARRKGKTPRRKARTVPLKGDLRLSILNYLGSMFPNGCIDPSKPLFPSRYHAGRKPITRVQAHRFIKAACAVAGIDSGRVATHSMRKSFCAAIYAGTGQNLYLTSKVMGNASVLTTARYLESTADDIDAAIMAIQSPSYHEFGARSAGATATPMPSSFPKAAQA